MNDYFINSGARAEESGSGLFEASEYERVASFYGSRSYHRLTPLRRLPNLASDVGIGELLIKDESQRDGLNAFKILGVRYAIHRLVEEGALDRNTVLCCATDGNHGRAVARVARELGMKARVYVPKRMVPARQNAIASEGAEIIVVDGTYDDAVRRMALESAARGHQIISDTAWPGYERIPRWIMAGYTQMLEEAVAQWRPVPAPDVVLVQGGVGGLACAVVSWLCSRFGVSRPFTIVCEPVAAACLLETARAGEPKTFLGKLETIMACLACAEVSSIAWPVLTDAADAFVAIEDRYAEEAMCLLSSPSGDDPPLISGESGSCGLAALLAILRDGNLQALRDCARLSPDSRVLLLNTEGATDPESFRRITARSTPAETVSTVVRGN